MDDIPNAAEGAQAVQAPETAAAKVERLGQAYEAQRLHLYDLEAKRRRLGLAQLSTDERLMLALLPEDLVRMLQERAQAERLAQCEQATGQMAQGRGLFNQYVPQMEWNLYQIYKSITDLFASLAQFEKDYNTQTDELAVTVDPDGQPSFATWLIPARNNAIRFLTGLDPSGHLAAYLFAPTSHPPDAGEFRRAADPVVGYKALEDRVEQTYVERWQAHANTPSEGDEP